MAEGLGLEECGGDEGSKAWVKETCWDEGSKAWVQAASFPEILLTDG